MNRVMLLVVLLMVSAFPGGLDVAEAAPNPIPITTVTLDVDDLEVRVYPYSLSMAIITGNVSVETCGCIGRVTVKLTHDLDVGWPVRIEPRTIRFINPADEPFRVIIIIPPGHHPLEGKLTITGVARSPGLGPNYGTDDCRITLSPFYLSRLEVIGSPCVVGEDGEARFPVRVWNLGTAEDVYSFDVSPGQLPMMEWEGPGPITVPPRSFVETNITIQYEDPSGPPVIWSSVLTVKPDSTTRTDIPPSHYVGGGPSREVLLYDAGGALGPLMNVDLSTVMTILLVELALIVSVLAVNHGTGDKGRGDGTLTRTHKKGEVDIIRTGQEEIDDASRKD